MEACLCSVFYYHTNKYPPLRAFPFCAATYPKESRVTQPTTVIQASSQMFQNQAVCGDMRQACRGCPPQRLR
jgi:hypothetical protein